MKVEHNQRWSAFHRYQKELSKIIPVQEGPRRTRLVPDQRCRAAIKLWGKTPDHQLTRKTRLRTLPHAPINEGET